MCDSAGPTYTAAVADQPLLSVVVLNWNALDLTRACVASLRATTDVPSELIIVDNGSEPEVAEWAKQAADVPVLLEENLGFAPGMNAGLAAASGTYVLFANNDTLFPPGWAGLLLETARGHRGITAPAVTAAGGPYGVRAEPGTEVITVPRFRHLPSGVAYLTERSLIESLGGWDERYVTAGREDLDLLFTYWVNELSVTLDTRVLVHHESSATVERLAERSALWDRNWKAFIAKWTDPNSTVPRLETVAVDLFEQRRAEAATVATWMDRWHQAEEGRKEARRTVRSLEASHSVLQQRQHRMELPFLGRLWSRLRAGIPGPIRQRLFPLVRGLYYRAFPGGRTEE